MSTLSLPSRPALRIRALSRPRPELLGLLGLAAVLNLWALGQNGWANDYYSGAVRSMASSWHNFLYASFDPSGVMTVDKPPLSLWVQALSARVFGFNSLAILIPQALMGMASVALVYDLTRRRFGRVAGAVAGVVLALTPMTVAISRHNNPDALLVLCCVAALWFVVRALEDGRTKWLVWAGVCVGLGFETKMAAALLVVPAIAAAWLWVAPRGRAAAVRQLLAGGAAMAVVGLAWPLLVTLTPASDRPWISGTSNNSIWSLMFGYNGLGRLDGQAGGPQAFGGAGPFGGASGPFRLLNEALGGQAGWLLGFALVGGLGIVAASRLRRADARTGWVIAVGGSLLVTAVAFSFASGIFHPYYVSELAPFLAALVGAGVAVMRRSALAPLAVAAGVLTELVVLHNTPGTLGWLPPVLVVAGGLAVVALTLGRDRLRSAALAGALGVLMIAPAAWSVQTLGHATNGTFPAGGPAAVSFAGGPRGFGGGPGGPGGPGGAGGAPAGGGGFGGGFGGNSQSLTQAQQYAAQHGGGTIAVSSQKSASSSIITSDAKVAGLGGFSGRESEVTVKWLSQAVHDGRIRWVLVDDGGFQGPGRDGRVGSSKLMSAVSGSCKPTSVTSLYDCQGSSL
jgi:4-amino-4-deoxy-L-arabinose transferase-like glycosyltransferase